MPTRSINSALPKAVLAIGSNLGDRARFLARACSMLESAHIRIVRRSGLYITRPAEGSTGGAFTNAALVIETSLRPRELLHRCQNIERGLGRVRRARWGPRTIDIDIILYGNSEVSAPGVTIPHPRWRERDFVIVPVLELDCAPSLLGLARTEGPPGSSDSIATLARQAERHILRRQEWPLGPRRQRNPWT